MSPAARPTVDSFADWLAWPLRTVAFNRRLAERRARPHRFACPACGNTSADGGYCLGTLSRDERNMGRHRWYATSAGGYPATKTWIAERFVPIESWAARCALAERAWLARVKRGAAVA